MLIFLKSEPFAQSLKKGLETSGYRGTAVTSESVALTEANANVPSLIILDRRSGAVANSPADEQVAHGSHRRRAGGTPLLPR